MARRVLITGCSSGIGRAACQGLRARGWTVIAAARNPDDVAALRADGFLAVRIDHHDSDSIAAGFTEAVALAGGRIDALFNNAGVTLPGAPIDEIDVDAFRNLIDINVVGAFIAARAAFGQMRRQDPQGGRIINNGSISAYVLRWGSVPYTTSKHAVLGLTRTLSLDGRPFNIACGQIDIGNALTDMATAMTKGVPQADGSKAIEPVMDVKHVAQSVLHMATLPLEANVQFMTVMASGMPFIGRG